MWTERQRVVLVLKLVMDVAELRDAEMDALADLDSAEAY